MTQSPDNLTKTPPIKPALDEAGQDVRIEPLKGGGWLAAVMALHVEVRAAMSPETQPYYLLRDERYFADLLAGRSGVLFGALAQGRLIGMVAIVPCADFAQARQQRSITYPDADGAMALEHKDKLAVIQSLAVHPHAAGQRLSQGLIRAATKGAYAEGATPLFAQVAQGHGHSCLCFFKSGFAIVRGWSAEHDRFLLRYTGPVCACSADQAKEPWVPTRVQQTLFQQEGVRFVWPPPLCGTEKTGPAMRRRGRHGADPRQQGCWTLRCE